MLFWKGYNYLDIHQPTMNTINSNDGIITLFRLIFIYGVMVYITLAAITYCTTYVGINSPQFLPNLQNFKSQILFGTERRHEMSRDSWSYKVAQWHYKPTHRSRYSNGIWHPRVMSKYRDGDGKYFNYPPPNYSVREFFEQQLLPQ